MLTAPTVVSGSVEGPQQHHNDSHNVQIYTCGSGSSGSFEALEPGPGSSWYHDSFDDNGEVLTVDDVVGQLVQSTDAATTLTLLQQLTNPLAPLHGCIISCDAWQPLLQLLPVLLRSPCRPTAAAAEQLLLQQLAPELLDCSPEPLAELLIALLTAAILPNSCQVCAASKSATQEVADGKHNAESQLQPDDSNRHAVGSTAAAAAAAARMPVSPGCACALQQQYKWSDIVVQVVLIGLHKLGRQWHFLDGLLSQQVCSAVMAMLLQPFLLHRKQQQQQQQQKQQQGVGQQEHMQQADGHVAEYQQQQQQHQQQGVQGSEIGGLQGQQQAVQQQQQASSASCLAEQLLLADPSMGWWHRLHSNSKSCKQIKVAAASSGLVQQLLVYTGTNKTSPPQLAQHSHGQGLQSAHVPSNVGVGCGAAAIAEQGTCKGLPDISSSQQLSSSSNSSGNELLNCLVAQLLAAFVSTPSGRQLMAEKNR